jgi:hypothetical protein
MRTPSRYRPLTEGVYLCFFSGLDKPLKLRWRGGAWTWCAKLVDTKTMIAWQGCYEDS